jgi:hypothetical protein
MSAPNAELAYKILDHIDAHPESWDQGSWDCGTTACFAGWALRLSGVKVTTGTHIVVDGPAELLGKELPDAADALLGISVDLLNEHGYCDPYDGLLPRDELGEIVAEIFGPRPDVTA